MGIPAVSIGAAVTRMAHREEENADASTMVPGIPSMLALTVALRREAYFWRQLP